MTAFSIKENLIRQISSKFKTCSVKDLVKEDEKTNYRMGEIFANYRSEKGLYLEYIKTLKTGKSKKSVKNMRKEIF